MNHQPLETRLEHTQQQLVAKTRRGHDEVTNTIHETLASSMEAKAAETNPVLKAVPTARELATTRS